MTSNKSVLEQNKTGIPKFIPLLIGLLVVSLISLILLARVSPRNTQLASYNFVQATQAFVPGQAMTINAENITIFVPENSVSLPGTISVVSQEPNLFPAADQPEWTRPQIIEVLFLDAEATPVHGIIFSNPVQVCFTITPAQWEDFTQRPDAYQVQYYAVENHPAAWQSLPMILYDDLSMLCGETMHFSLFALAIKSDPNIPVTGLTPTPTRTIPPTVPGVRRTPIRTQAPPTNTLVSPSATSQPPTSTQLPPTATEPLPLPTETDPPPTESQPAPTEPAPSATPQPPDPTTEPPTPGTEPPPSGGILPVPTAFCLLLCP